MILVESNNDLKEILKYENAFQDQSNLCLVPTR